METETTFQVSQHDVEAVRCTLLSRLTERTPPKRLVGLEQEEQRMFALLERTVTRGESNSALLVGPRGCGKTMLMRRVIHRLEEQCRELEESTGPVVEIVKRKSSQHTATATTPSRRAALRRAKKASRHTENATDIDMQDADLTALSLVPDDPETISKTSQSKLASHTTSTEAFIVVKLNGIIFSDDRIALRDIARQLNVIPDGRGFSSFAECLQHLLRLFAAGRTDQTRPIIFILDEFDAFAQRPKQTLLYNLFDLTQSGRVPVAVIGLTCRMDVVDMLEKRVKSRFSHRIIHLHAPSTFGDYVQVARETLQVTKQDVADVDESYLNAFDNAILALLDDPTFMVTIRRPFDLTKDVRSLFRICMELTARLSQAQPFLTITRLTDLADVRREDAKMAMLRGVSVLELCLMVAAKRLLDRGQTQFNFAMIYDEYYQQFAGTTTGSMKLYKRPVALKAFERLLSLELVLPIEHQRSLPKEYRMNRLALNQDQVIDAVKCYQDCPDYLRQWAIRFAIS